MIHLLQTGALIPPAYAALADATLTGTAGDDRLDGGTGAETIRGLGGDDVLQGFGGDDILSGQAGDDALVGGAGRDELSGGAGDDVLDGGSGDDTLDGGGGQNTLRGGSGRDLFEVTDLGSASIDGGSGFDTISFAAAARGVNIVLQGGRAFASLVSIENAIGTAFADTIHGAADSRGLIDGGEGNDLLFSGHGNTTLLGGAGDDQLYGKSSGEQLAGGDGDDALYFVRGVADGGAGQDRLAGAASLGTVLTGGADADTFAFTSPGQGGVADLVTDLADEDLIDLSNLDADAHHAGDQAFVLVSALDGHAGQAALAYDAGTDETALLLDTDGDGVADITVRLSGDHTGFTNFVL